LAHNIKGTVGGCTANNTGIDQIQFKTTKPQRISLPSRSALEIKNGTLTITGPGPSSNSIVISGTFCINNVCFQHQVMKVDQGATVTLDTLTISDGAVGDVVSGGNGGGILNSGTLTIMNSVVQNNTAVMDATGFGGNGGGIYNNGTLTVSKTQLNNNTASSGGGVYKDASLTVNNDSSFSGNSAVSPFANGGGILNNAATTIANSTFSGNDASFGAGIVNLHILTISNSTFSGNSANFGGGIASEPEAGTGGRLSVTGVTFSANHAISGDGGGILNGGLLECTNTTFSGNTAGNRGGDIKNQSGVIKKNQCLLLSPSNNDPGSVDVKGTILAGSSGQTA
jgi:hypothetical protein